MQLNAAAVAARPTARSARRQKWKPPHPDSLSDEELAVVGAACELQLGRWSCCARARAATRRRHAELVTRNLQHSVSQADGEGRRPSGSRARTGVL